MNAKRPDFHVVILAAGLGTRMKSARAKVLHEVCGEPMVRRVARLALETGAASVTAVVGHQADTVTAAVADLGVRTVLQEEQKGTGHALLCARDALKDARGWLLLLSGDVPLLTRETLERMVAAAESRDGAVVLTAQMDDPAGYGRILRAADGGVLRIVEQKDASAEETRVHEINTGIYLWRIPEALQLLDKVSTANAAGEYYLTDLVPLLRTDGWFVRGISGVSAQEVMGVNSRRELAEAERILQARIVARHMAAGVTFLQPSTVRVTEAVEIGPDTVIHPNVALEGTTRIGRDAVVETGCVVRDSVLGDGALLKPYTVVSESAVDAGAAAGPFAHLRPGTHLEAGVKVGNFVETKKARLRKGAKASHLSYLGDCDVGAGSNIGAGTITCNYDGEKKHRTVLGENVFIGSDTQLVAPVTVGDGAYVGAGTTVTKDVPPKALAVSRTPQKNIEDWADRKKKK